MGEVGMFKVGERVVYPGHGVAIIKNTVSKKIGLLEAHLFELRFVNKEVTVLVPIEKAKDVGIRSLCTIEHVALVYKILSGPYIPAHCDAAIENWNKRSKKYMGKMRTGDLKELGLIYHYLQHIGKKKELSFGEKLVLTQAENILVEEIALVENMAREAVIERVRSLIR
jgi:CarD family transcriptional regulator